MSTDLQLKSSCSGCGSTTDLYGSNCKHMTLCLSCGKTMAENRAKCVDCGATLSRLIREYNVRASSANDKNYFIGRFAAGLPDFSKKKSAENKWSLQKDGLHGRQVTDTLREKYKNKPWLLEDETGQSQFQGHLEGSQSATYYLLMKERKEFVAIPAEFSYEICLFFFSLVTSIFITGQKTVGRCVVWHVCLFRYNFNKVAQYKQLTLEEAEEKMKNRKKTADGYQRWMMKAANNGPAAFGEHGKFDDKESNTGGGKSRKKTGEDDEGHVSDKGEEDEDEESERKNRLGLNKGTGDDDEEGPRGGDHDLDDDDVEKGDDWEHEEIFTDDDEAVGNDPEEREDLAPEVPAPPEIKQEEEEEEEDNEEGGGLSKSGKELKKLLGRTSGLNESDAEDDDDDDDDMDDDLGVPPVIAPKQKDALKEEPVDNSPSKPTATGPARGTPSKSSKGKRKSNEEAKPSNPASATPKKVKSENEAKSSAKDVNGSASKSSAPPKGTPPSSSKTGASTAASGPVSEEEIRAVLRQKTPVTTQDLVAKFKARLRSSEDKQAFAEILKRISKIQKTANGSSYVILRDK
ncbi:Transcription initiation factor IIF subunit alpha [Mucuna pruriens]|uniref:Transcription initiation factor IIF subunit alpha n=1 Tax=Mucuna pruriens TaxID=157652 RepID=A0A371EQW7_MUCPR|nr:Transcription initiation factor IIF subunit alpha [Mucuna pruriens]